MANFYATLSNLRAGADISEDVARARAWCAGGCAVGSLQEFREHLETKFPVFSEDLTEGAFPEALAAFVASVSGTWPKSKQHAIHACLGAFTRELVRKSKDSLPSAKYRDATAGSLNHEAVGLTHAVSAALDEGLSYVLRPKRARPQKAPPEALAAADVALVVDISGSMGSFKEALVAGASRFLRDARAARGDVTVQLSCFNNRIFPLYTGAARGALPSEASLQGALQPARQTALLDALGRALDEQGQRLAATAKSQRPQATFTVMTDGVENASHLFSHEDIKRALWKHGELHGATCVYPSRASHDGRAMCGSGVPPPPEDE